MISLEKLKTLTPLQKLPKNVGDLGKIIAAKCFKSCPKSNKSPNLVTLTFSETHEKRSRNCEFSEPQGIQVFIAVPIV